MTARSSDRAPVPMGLGRASSGTPRACVVRGQGMAAQGVGRRVALAGPAEAQGVARRPAGRSWGLGGVVRVLTRGSSNAGNCAPRFSTRSEF
jgi:hypothetical protein